MKPRFTKPSFLKEVFGKIPLNNVISFLLLPNISRNTFDMDSKKRLYEFQFLIQGDLPLLFKEVLSKAGFEKPGPAGLINELIHFIF